MIHNKSQSINIDESFSKVLIYALLFPSFNTFLKGISSSLNLPEQILSGLLFVFYLVVYSGAFAKVGVKYILEYIKILVIFLTVLFLNYYLFPHTRIYYFEYFNNFRQVVIIYLPAAVAGSRIRSFSTFFGKIRFMAYSGVLLSLVTLLIYSKLDYMAFALQILPLSMSLFVVYFDNNNKYDLVMFLVSSVMILLAGSRMSLFSLVLFTIFFIVLNKMNHKNIKTWIYVPVIMIFTLIVGFYWRDILMFFQYILEIFNISSRNITKMLNNESSEIGFRALIYEQAKQYLNSNNYKPLGLFGDRYILRQIWPELVYVHSFILELLMSFGPIITFFVISYIFTYIIRGLLVKDLDKKNASLLFCLVIIPRLIVSGSFIVEGYFYLMLGVLRSLKASKKY